MGLELGSNSSSVVDAAVIVSDGVLGGVALATVQGDCGGEGGVECMVLMLVLLLLILRPLPLRLC